MQSKNTCLALDPGLVSQSVSLGCLLFPRKHILGGFFFFWFFFREGVRLGESGREEQREKERKDLK